MIRLRPAPWERRLSPHNGIPITLHVVYQHWVAPELGPTAGPTSPHIGGLSAHELTT